MRPALIPTLFLVFAASACASAGPPHGPKYTPEASQEAATDCPDERNKAQAAREATLGEKDSRLKTRAGEAVFAHAGCEESALESLSIRHGDAEDILAGLRTAREQSNTAINLYQEVELYGEPLLAIRSLIAQARVKITFATRVTNTRAPVDLEVSQRAEFLGELNLAAKVLHGEATLLLEKALLLAGGVTEAAASKQEACALLLQISASSPACNSI